MKTGYQNWLDRHSLKQCTECKVVLSRKAFGLNRGRLRPNCLECHVKKKKEWERGQRASLGDYYIRQLLGTTDPALIAVKRLQLQLLRMTK